MKAVILAGGMGTRISEETVIRPKPMIEIGSKPILWHIMKAYSSHGVNEFVVCLGYRGYMIKEYFANYHLHTCDVSFDIAGNSMEVIQSSAEPWRVTLVDTGEDTQTGGRLKRVLHYVGDEEFCFTDGDGLSAIDIGRLVDFHHDQGTLATVTAIRPPGRFEGLDIEGDRIRGFQEKEDYGPELAGIEIDRGQYLFNQVYAWYLQWRVGSLPRRTFLGRLRSLPPRDWLLLLKGLAPHLSLKRVRRNVRIDRDEPVQHLWPGLRPLPEVSDIEGFRRWVTSAAGS